MKKKIAPASKRFIKSGALWERAGGQEVGQVGLRRGGEAPLPCSGSLFHVGRGGQGGGGETQCCHTLYFHNQELEMQIVM